ncbi:hypothetical protein NC653_005627 [Populus alba x Populus x berolinensis]|uniref:Uncharacterized protein n=1 Tax=Populus alba x Populus x berolinensis TaxID=444605 RepID=A0AAD6RCQ9_9ROSI|nr:hypothetical protein NC653_005627 [Populus alba x Populus x berolinensis]
MLSEAFFCDKSCTLLNFLYIFLVFKSSSSERKHTSKFHCSL